MKKTMLILIVIAMLGSLAFAIKSPTGDLGLGTNGSLVMSTGKPIVSEGAYFLPGGCPVRFDCWNNYLEVPPGQDPQVSAPMQFPIWAFWEMPQ